MLEVDDATHIDDETRQFDNASFAAFKVAGHLEALGDVGDDLEMQLTGVGVGAHDGHASTVRLEQGFQTVTAAQLFCVESGTVNGVVAEFGCRLQERNFFGEELVVFGLQADGLDELRISSVLVGTQFCVGINLRILQIIKMYLKKTLTL